MRVAWFCCQGPQRLSLRTPPGPEGSNGSLPFLAAVPWQHLFLGEIGRGFPLEADFVYEEKALVCCSRSMCVGASC
jgi:hypothetical protein